MAVNRFSGDGRVVLEPSGSLPGCRSIKIRRSNARMLIEKFMSEGHTTHSGMGSLIWVIAEWCHLNSIQYTIVAVPSQGYFITKNT